MRDLSKTDIDVLKGIALLLLLCHHCFANGEPYNDIFVFGIPLIHKFCVFCQLCVSVFVFLSGYGLTAKAIYSNGIGRLGDFYRQRYSKLFFNFWVIYLLFVPLGVFVFHRTFQEVYGDKLLVGAISDFFGLHKAIIGHPYGYNATWWFLSCIIFLYLFFPFLWKARRYWFLMIPFAVMFPTFVQFIPVVGKSGCGAYMLSFVCGMLMVLLRPMYKLEQAANNNQVCNQLGWERKRFVTKILIFLFFLVACLYRFKSGRAYLWDAAITSIGVFLYSMLNIKPAVIKVMTFIGKHSSNIFMFHTFIYSYYFHNFIYWSRNPLLIILTLLSSCILISMLIEWLKKRLHFYSLLQKIA